MVSLLLFYFLSELFKEKTILIHTFTYKNDYFVTDTESGAVHALDKLSFDVLSCMEKGTDPQTTLRAAYTDTQIEEVLQDAAELKKEGLLFCEPAYDTAKPVFNAPVIKSLCLHVAHDCNLRCAYCFGDKGAFFGEKALMSLETAKKALEFLMEKSGSRKNLEVDFFGGEPLLNFNVVKDTVTYGRELEKRYKKIIRFTMTTNAYHVTPQMEAFINAEMKNLVISIDGRKETHDAMRKTAGGKGSYDSVVKNAIELVKRRNGQEHYIRGTFTANNLDFAKDVEAIYDLGFDEISLEPVVTGEDMALKKEHLGTLIKEYEKLAEYYEQKKASEGKPFHFFHFNINLSSGPCLNKRLRGCGAGSEYAAIAPNGELYPCHQFVGKEEFCMGSLDEGIKDYSIGEKFMASHVWNKEKCSACWAKYYCSGGCAANAYNQNHDMSKPHDLSCELEKKRIELAIALAVRGKEGTDEAEDNGQNAGF